MHSNDPYIDQSPEALRLTLVDGQIDLSGFHVYGSRTLRCGDVHLEARVIGASHVISYSMGKTQLHEVFACISPPVQAHTSWVATSMYDQPIERRFNGLDYRFEVRTVPWTDPEPQEVTALLARCTEVPSENAFGFVEHFPQGKYLVTPKTIIVGSHDRDTLVIDTAHSYPNVRGLVLSRTHLRTGGTK